MSDVATLPFSGYAWRTREGKGVFIGQEQLDPNEPLVAVVRLQSKFDLKLAQGVFQLLPAAQAVVAAYAHDNSEQMRALRTVMQELNAAAEVSMQADLQPEAAQGAPAPGSVAQ